MVVPVPGLSRLTRKALNTGASPGDEVRAVTACHQDAKDRAHRRPPVRWSAPGRGAAVARTAVREGRRPHAVREASKAFKLP